MMDLKDLNMLLSVQDAGCCGFMIPSKYKDQDSYEKTMDEYDRQLFEETMKPFVNSGHAFICFDSVESLNAIIRYYR